MAIPSALIKKPLTGLAAKKAAAAELAVKETQVEVSPRDMEHRLGIIFDDSISMSDRQIQDAHAGIEEFLRSCTPNKTAVTVVPLNGPEYSLSKNLPALALLVKKIHQQGSTPLVERLNYMLEMNPLTRAIVFSDGQPNSYPDSAYNSILKHHVPVDTIYISDANVDNQAIEFMKKLAADTGGIFLHFDSTRSNFRTAFKYLSPGLRFMLADKSFADKIQGI